jgi:hypothetical protein|tara:strand:- start:409 stop:693 length:285 start_codon:yes stop_codon:yes gene_type:complete
MSDYGLRKKDCYNVTKKGRSYEEWFEYYKDKVYPHTGVGETETIFSIETKEFEDRDTFHGEAAEEIQMKRSFRTWYSKDSNIVLVPKKEMDKNK